MKSSVRVAIGFGSTHARTILGERIFDLGDSVDGVSFAPVNRVLVGSARHGPGGEDIADFGSKMLEEFRHDGEAAGDDAGRKLGLAPQAKWGDHVAFV